MTQRNHHANNTQPPAKLLPLAAMMLAGSIGAAAYPARVFKGIRMAGHMGARQVTQRGLQVVDRDPERNILLVKGAVPGAVGSIVFVRPD